MKLSKIIQMFFFKIFLLFLFTITFSQEKEETKPINLNGFRIGLTYIAGDTTVKELRDAVGDPYATPLIAQFGWQLERQYSAGKGGLAAIVELIPLLGGLNLGIVIPSLSALIGIRTGKGYELGAGPLIYLGGSEGEPKFAAGFVFGAGMTRKIGNLYIPLNFVLAQGKTSGTGEGSSGFRFTLMTGFAFK